MKKKIKDLTLGEAQKMCEKRKSCKGCPMFFEINDSGNYCPYTEIINNNIKKLYLEREVEVDE